MNIRKRILTHWSSRWFVAFACLSVAALVWAEAEVTPNYKDADIRQLIETVGEITGKTMIIDPRVTGKVTLLSSTPMKPDALYEAFLSVLEVHGYVAIQSGDMVKILPSATARQYAGPIGGGDSGPDDLVTQVIQVRNIGAAQLVPILRPLVPQYGHLVAHASSNMLVISDRASNVTRMISIISRIDQASDEDIEVVPLNHASAADLVRILTTLTQQPRSDGVPVSTSLVADARTNSILIGGDKNERVRLRALIAHLDTPLEDGGDTQVRYLRYADAEELSGKLQTHFSEQVAGAAGQPTTGNKGQNSVNVWADTQTNAIVINAPPKMMRSMMQIVDKLDIRRAQVLVEAIIVEVIADKTSELGVTWAVQDAAGNNPIGVTNFPDFGPGIVQVGGAANGGGDPSGLIGTGITVGVGRISDSGISFGAIMRALEGDADTNIISTPSIVTTDNEEATLNVGQEVPFVTGSYSNSGGGGGGGPVNPFQTIQRQQVGVKLSITPQINEGNSMLLTISQEISSIAQSAASAVDLITNQRIIETTVIVDDGEILVLGGLIEDAIRESDQRVPVLGRIPGIGALFRSRKTDKVKTNLMVFIRPTILRDSVQTSRETNAKYQMIRDVQQGLTKDAVPLMRNEERPILPPLETDVDGANADTIDDN